MTFQLTRISLHLSLTVRNRNKIVNFLGMNIYKILRVFSKIKSKRLKLLGIFGAHKLSRRYIGVFLDPVMACNLRCRMCYMSDPTKRPAADKETQLTAATLDYLSKTFFPHALKLQIGCATEPTLYHDLSSIIKKGKEYGVPYISITSNGQLLTKAKLEDLIDAGLDELTLSIHGFEKEIYETMMPGASFEKLKQLMSNLKQVKAKYPKFSIRINYVMNEDNVKSLKQIFTMLDGLKIDVLQLRPVQKLSDSSYTNFSMEGIKQAYEGVLLPIQEKCRQEGIICLCPTLDNLDSLEANNTSTDPFIEYIEELTYYYLTQKGVNKDNFEWQKDSFSSYHKRSKTGQKIAKAILTNNYSAKEKSSTKKLNYSVK